MVQLSVESEMALGLPGQIADLGPRSIRTRINNSKQTSNIVVTTAEDSALFRVTINGEDMDFTSDGTATKAEIALGVAAAINAGAQPVTATEDSVDNITVRADVSGVAYTISVTNPATGVLTLSSLILNEISVPFGLLVVHDLTGAATGVDKDRIAHLPSVTTDISVRNNASGIALLNQAEEQAIANADNPGYRTQSAMNVMGKGYVYVLTEDAIAVNANPFFRFIATGTEQLGAMRSDADSGDAVQLPDGAARIEKGASAGGLAILQLNLP